MTKGEKKEKLTVQGWIMIKHLTARKNINNGKYIYMALDDNRAAVMLDRELYGALLALPGYDSFMMHGYLSFRNGWYINCTDLILLDANGVHKSIRGYCPEGFEVE